MYDEPAFIAQHQMFDRAEAVCKREVSSRIQDARLLEAFHSGCKKGFVRLGWKKLLKEMNINKELEIEILQNQLNHFAQREQETDLAYADRLQALLDRFALFDYPKPNPIDRGEREAVRQFEARVARKFLLGFRDDRREARRTSFHHLGIHDDFDEMRDFLKSVEKDDEVARTQRGDADDEDTYESGGRAMQVQKKHRNPPHNRPASGSKTYEKEQGSAYEIFVGNISQKVTVDDLKKAFQQFGRIKSARLHLDETTKKPLGAGFVGFSSPIEAFKAVQNARNLELPARTAQRRIYVKIAQLKSTELKEKGKSARKATKQSKQSEHESNESDLPSSDTASDVSAPEIQQARMVHHARMARFPVLNVHDDDSASTYSIDSEVLGIVDSEDEGADSDVESF
ncbi:hypothetical protein HDU96_004181, partial [Phlyctochytrium bullatum]